MIKKITNISDQGIICDFGEEVNKDINKKVISLFNYLKEKSNNDEIKGIYNIIPSYNKLVVHFDLEKNNSHKIKEIISSIDLKKLTTSQSGKTWTIPVCYDDEFAIDLENLTKSLKLSKEEIIKQGLASATDWAVLEKYALALFQRGKEIAAKQGLILVDTKYEFGKIGDTIYLMDEIHTPDSSRYFYADGFEQRQASKEKQKQLSKEFVREWLIANNFMGKEGQTVPAMSAEWIDTISKRYIELYEQVIGEKFKPQQLSEEETYKVVCASLEKLS